MCGDSNNKPVQKKEKVKTQYIAYGYSNYGELEAAGGDTKEEAIQNLADVTYGTYAIGFIQVENKSGKTHPEIPTSKMVI